MPAMAFPGIPGSTRASRAASREPIAPPVPAAPDWPKQATETIVRVVDTVRDKTTGPAVSAARVVIYGTVLALLAGPLFVLALIGSMTGVEGLLLMLGEATGWAWLHDPMWIVYLLFGMAFLLLGLWLWGKAKKTPAVV